MRFSLFILPIAISQSLSGAAGLKAVSSFLGQADVPRYIHLCPSLDCALQVSSASFTWTTTEPKGGALGISEKAMNTTSTLDTPRSPMAAAGPSAIRIQNITLLPAQLTVVVGKVGAGKTSFLTALAGLMNKVTGTVEAHGRISYCPKEPWLQNTTVRDNICFDQESDLAAYQEVLEACCLTVDLESLPHGDQTLVSEAGASLSGGQRSRIGLARALIAHSEIILLDDCLSALDSHISVRVFQKAIRGLLRHRCCVLATNAASVVAQADNVVWLQGGEVRAVGSYHVLLEQYPEFADVIQVEDSGKVGFSSDPAQIPLQTVSEKMGDQDSNPIPLTIPPSHKIPDGRSALWQFAKMFVHENAYLVPAYIILLMLSQATYVMFALWISWWVSDSLHISRGGYLLGLSLFALGQVVLLTVMSFILVKAVTSITKRLFDTAVSSVMYARAAFYRQNSLGKIVSMFSKDLDVLDHRIVEPIQMSFIYISTTISVLGMMISYVHYSAIPIVALMIGFLFATTIYHRTARELKRYREESRSKLMSQLVETSKGAETIRLARKEHSFITNFQSHLDITTNATILAAAAQRWLSLRLDLVGNLVILFTFLIVIVGNLNISPGTLGILLTFALGSVQMFQSIVKQLGDIEEGAIAIKALDEGCRSIPQESHGSSKPPWSSLAPGNITFDNVSMTYTQGSKPVLDRASLSISAGEHVGIVGQTGSGKSSLIAALLRLYEINSGAIILDDQNITELDHQQLRQRFSIVPQAPFLFHGTIRSNLDPETRFSDTELEKILADVGFSVAGALAPTAGLPISLNDAVEEGGANFSYGERQMLACARVLINPNPGIVLLDEATSSLDASTDIRLQQTLTRAFANQTMISITHRLNVVGLYDKVYVVGEGRIIEHGAPRELFSRPNGVFRDMCIEQGVSL